MNHISLLSVVGALVLSASVGCNGQKNYDDAYTSGFNEGLDKGYSRGYSAGYEDAELHFKCASETKSPHTLKSPLEKYKETHPELREE
ncbi:MAG: hypothetical protein RL557_984 [archaeon]|jgi:flagellar biosynthesis/type III secretory pathway protein FliH